MTNNALNQNEPLVSYMVDLRAIDQTITDLVNSHTPQHYRELSSSSFLPGVYQLVANELCHYRNKIYVKQQYVTKSFRHAYFEEDRLEIVDEVLLKIRDIILGFLGVNYFERPIRVSFITHNQWIVSYPKGA